MLLHRNVRLFLVRSCDHACLFVLAWGWNCSLEGQQAAVLNLSKLVLHIYMSECSYSQVLCFKGCKSCIIFFSFSVMEWWVLCQFCLLLKITQQKEITFPADTSFWIICLQSSQVWSVCSVVLALLLNDLIITWCHKQQMTDSCLQNMNLYGRAKAELSTIIMHWEIIWHVISKWLLGTANIHDVIPGGAQHCSICLIVTICCVDVPQRLLVVFFIYFFISVCKQNVPSWKWRPYNL